MTASFTAVVASRGRVLLIALALTSIAIIATVRGVEPPKARELFRLEDPGPWSMEVTATITEVAAGGSCGIYVAFGYVRYGEDFGAVVPCLDIARFDGLRFAPGDTQTLHVDAQSRVTAITWQGRTWRFDTRYYPTVKTPAFAVGELRVRGDGAGVRYEAPGWRWSDVATK